MVVGLALLSVKKVHHKETLSDKHVCLGYGTARL